MSWDLVRSTVVSYFSRLFLVKFFIVVCTYMCFPCTFGILHYSLRRGKDERLFEGRHGRPQSLSLISDSTNYSILDVVNSGNVPKTLIHERVVVVNV